MSVASVGYIARVVAVLAACAAAAGSATSTSNNQPSATAPSDQNNSPPPAQQMDGARALGLWRSTFGAVKIEADDSHGGLSSGSLQGVWLYQRQGQEVVGYFAGNLRGNVLQFRWQEPNNPPLTGEGYLVFDVQGRQYTGRWWSDKRDRVGDWNGWRQAGPQGAQRPGTEYGAQGDAYGRRQQPAPDPRGYPGQPSPGQPYQGQPQPYQSQPQPYQGQPQDPAQPYPGQQDQYPPPPSPREQPYQQPYPQPPPPSGQGRPANQPQPRQQPYQQPYQPQPNQPAPQPSQQYY